jgi:hypothetical protein
MFEEFAKSIASEEHHPIKKSFKKASDQFHN